MSSIKKALQNSFINKKWFNILFYIEFILTIIILIMLGKARTSVAVLICFLGVAIISNLIVYYLSEKILDYNLTFEKLKEEAAKDYLTGLNNVRSFDRSFNELLKKAKANDESIALLAIDVDYFKKVNDNYGHAAGDLVLKELSSIFEGSVRDFDVIGRVGGEEFSVILRDCGVNRSQELAERIRKNVEKHIFRLTCGDVIKVTVSIGIAVYPATVADIELFKEKADEKLYEAKHTGRNTFCI